MDWVKEMIGKDAGFFGGVIVGAGLTISAVWIALLNGKLVPGYVYKSTRKDLVELAEAVREMAASNQRLAEIYQRWLFEGGGHRI